MISWSAHKVKKIVLSDNGREAVVYDLQYRGVGANNFPVKDELLDAQHRASMENLGFRIIGRRGEPQQYGHGRDPPLGRTTDEFERSSSCSPDRKLRSAAQSLQKQDWPGAEALKKLDPLALPPSWPPP